MEGPLTKWTNLVNGWQYRWFVLDPVIGVLSYYTSLEKERKGERRGCVKLKGAQVGIDDTEDCTFTITVETKTFHFQARDKEERQRWLDALQEVRDLHSKCLNLAENVNSDEILANFDKKIVEADSYLQILIDQEEELKKKLSVEKQGDPIMMKIQNLIELIKQTIVCLQIAKQNAMTPLANIPVFDGVISGESDGTLKFDKEATEGIEALDWEEKDSHSHPVILHNSSSITVPIQHDLSKPSIPEKSYSSSDDEEYYDTNDTLSSPFCKNTIDDFDVVDESSNNGVHKPLQNDCGMNSETNVKRRSEFYDELYDSEEEELGSVQNHDSVITHILSQLRIGMDLTKITLPTFILEKRSTLEMYADFLAHADLWASISKGTSPQSRFVACMKWYLSAFHAGRKSSVAKKPYNPILGEVFRCFWNVNESTTSNSATPASAEQVNDSCGGLFTWAPSNSVVFIAEQVSHHPPISAFYAEHQNNKIYVNGHLWTKSKFLGLSIGVEMIGDAKIYLMDYDEEYVVTFPSGYGRNILSVPWVELGGRCTVKCVKTGYHATVDFKTKPFYNNKKDQVRAECFYSQEKKPFLVIEGEWNNRMYSKYMNDNKSEIFIDIHKMPTLKKTVQTRNNQLAYESRKLWEDVTRNLKLHKIEEATQAKSKLEQKQRDEAKYRKERNLAWKLRHFEELNGEYWFNHCLKKWYRS